ncbi:MAG: hypothetical protein ACE5NJ_05940 [Thermodesulfobacteriota bacterium]
MKGKVLADQEVVIIDGEEYVKIVDGGKEGSTRGRRYRYVPVDEYLSKRGEFSGAQGEKAAREEPLFQPEKGTMPPSYEVSKTASRERAETAASSIELRRKIIIAPFEEGEPGEDWGEMVAARLRDSLERRTDRILCLDDQIIADYFKRRGIESVRLDDPKVMRIASTVFGVQVLLHGTLSGPYVAATRGKGGNGEETALAIVRIQVKLLETATGRVMRSFEERNPIFATEERGEFSRDKTKLNAIQLAIEELTGKILAEIDRMGWYTRIVKIDGDRVYLNAGRLTGLKVGDLMDVYGPGGGKIEHIVGVPMDHFGGQRKGQVRVSQLFGTDAAMARVTSGGDFALSDVVRPSAY